MTQRGRATSGHGATPSHDGSGSATSFAPGKRAKTDGFVQRRGSGSAPSAQPDRRVSGADERTDVDRQGGVSLPFLDTIQASFGEHDLSGVHAHIGGQAADACADIGATAYASGQDVAFAGPPDLHTAAHEAAHVVQQRSGVHLEGGVGESGDAYEREADDVADAWYAASARSCQRLAATSRGATAACSARKGRRPPGVPTSSPSASRSA
jgi:hypothetical protein